MKAQTESAKNFTGQDFANKAPGFDRPTQRPRDEQQRALWQTANSAWWEASPMRYDWREEIGSIPGTQGYFREIDQRFFAAARRYMPWTKVPFDAEIPFDLLSNKDVLEIGVGHGSHAQLIAPRCRTFVGVDLTESAVEMTTRRLELAGIPARILRMDAEEMDFSDESFNYIWSWGVIHHSADTRRILEQMHRVLRPNGTASVMVYHRSWWTNYVVHGLLKGFLQGQLWKGNSIHEIGQRSTDGAIARYYTAQEWQNAVNDLFRIDGVKIYGQKSDVIALPPGRIKQFLENRIPDAFTRYLTNRLRLGSFLLVRMTKK